MKEKKYLFAAVLGVVFLFAGYNLYSYFSTQAVREAEEARLAEEAKIAKEAERARRAAEKQAEAERKEAERQAILEQEERQRAEDAAKRAEEERLDQEAEAAAKAAEEAERQRMEEANAQEAIARARTRQTIEDFSEDMIAQVRSMSPRYIADHPEEFLQVYDTQDSARPLGGGYGQRLLFQDGTTALMIFAAVSQDTAALQALLGAGLDINAANKQGFTALMFAASYNRPELVQFLLDKGADPAAKVYFQDVNALHLASLLNPNPDVVEVLAKAGFDLEVKTLNGLTPLILAAQENPNLEVVERLASLGADKGAYDEQGRSVKAVVEERIATGEPRFAQISPEWEARLVEALQQ